MQIPSSRRRPAAATVLATCLAVVATVVLVPGAHAATSSSGQPADDGVVAAAAPVEVGGVDGGHHQQAGFIGQEHQQQQHALGGNVGHEETSGDVDDGETVQHATGKRKKRKNIVVILTDDQDLTMDSPEYMPLLKEHIIEKGITFRNHFTSTAICCPSRVSLWTGKLPHNTNVTDVSPPHGGYPKFVARGLNENYLPVWLQAAGYATYYVGKLFNAHTIKNYNSPFPAGWTDNEFLLDPGTYSYLNPIFQRGKEEPVQHRGTHTAELTAEKALGFLKEALDARKAEEEHGEEKPFFLAVAPIAPHTNFERKQGIGGGPFMTEPIPLPKHEKLFPDVQVPRTDNFNPDTPSSVSWISKLPALNASSVAYLDHFYRQRLRSLQSVDELVDSIVSTLQAAGALDDTYIIYSSDNGYHVGQHRLPPGKECAFEEDIRIPLYIRGPGVRAGYEEEGVTGHVDLAPTVLDLAGVELRGDFDGRPVPIEPAAGRADREIEHDEDEPAAHEDRAAIAAQRRKVEHASVEFWGIALAEGEAGGFDGHGRIIMPNNTYKALRVLGAGYDLFYSVWCNNEHELYDLATDPGQLNNLYPKEASPRGDDENSSPQTRSILNNVKIHRVISRLDALMMVLKSCQGTSCVRPWSVLHPEEEEEALQGEGQGQQVQTLADALHEQYDGFYAQQAQVSFNWCDDGYLIEAEGPQQVMQFHEDGYTVWPHWT
ncbi:alkaline-phosphatase-like protein [Microdochium trichocladiopsis]|uniref:Alkaline-phosphatase-like protein n=1 Tax=Microdochium trichocladiopsis TaxID=1682393 RepID=A0A9P8Y0R1_9PEZI|nr:alkaline-phosphatase-like protein [Microdochium trichocladiopsis]KAH7027718.1 alkaline-phosphatase-like protein [Microdochium trichocladiopsis]